MENFPTQTPVFKEKTVEIVPKENLTGLNILHTNNEKPLSYNLLLAKAANILLLNRQKLPIKLSSKQQLPKIVGEIRHYPPANKEWKNSVYAYNKDSLTRTAALDHKANITIKSYFNLTNNKKLARSYRMRNLIRRSTSKRVYTSKPEIKQTNNNVNLTVYVFNREGQSQFRKLYFYNKNMNMNRDVYLHKIWLKKNMTAFKNTLRNKKTLKSKGYSEIASIRKTTNRKDINKTYIHNLLMKKYIASDAEIESVNRTSLDSTLPLESETTHIYGKETSYRYSNIVEALKTRNLIRKHRTTEKKLSKVISAYSKVNKKPGIKNFKPEARIGYFNKPFENYLIHKGSRKLNYKLRASNSVIKIKKNLSKFTIIKGKIKKPRFKKIQVPYSNSKNEKEINFFSFKLMSELKYIRKLFMFYFIKYMFSLLFIKIHKIKPSKEKTSELLSEKTGKTNWYSRLFTQSKDQRSLALNNLTYEFQIGDRVSQIGLEKQSNKRKAKNRVKKIIKIKFKNKYSSDKIKTLELLNLELLNLLKLTISQIPLKLNPENKAIAENSLDEKRIKLLKSFIFNKNNINFLYKKFERKYFLLFLAKFFKKELLSFNYYSKFLLNKLKFGKFLPGLKYMMNKIYSKKVKLNIVNLKYPHLNSDIYADLITSKLKKKLGLWRVLRRSISLAKLPFDYLAFDRTAELNKLQNNTTEIALNVFDREKTKLSNLKNTFILSEDKIENKLNKIYPYSFITGITSLENSTNNNTNHSSETKAVATGNERSKALKVLNMIRYKWVSGVRIEAAGRLTRRYTAARSVFKLKYKGSLKNIDYSQKADISKKNMSTVMLRNYAKANSQYTFTKSKRRIGAYGVKVWIASY